MKQFVHIILKPCTYLPRNSYMLPESFFEPTAIHDRTQFLFKMFNFVIKDGRIQPEIQSLM